MSDKLMEAKYLLNSPGLRPVGWDRHGVPVAWPGDTTTAIAGMLHVQNLLLQDIAEKLESNG